VPHVRIRAQAHPARRPERDADHAADQRDVAMPSELRSRSVLRDRALREPCRGDGRPLRDAVAKRKQGRRKRRRGEEGVRLEVVSRAEARSTIVDARWLRGGLAWQLCAMPNADHPDDPPDDPVEEAIRRDDDFAVRQIRELGDGPTGSRETLQSALLRLGATTKGSRCIRVVSLDERDCIKVVPPS